MNGTLYIVATPIGNMEDITLRALRVLGEVDAIFAEDTRRTLPLLTHYGIKKPIFASHEHNEREAAEKIVSMLREGKSVALLTDAGTPGVSDPGGVAVAQAIAAGMPVTVLPGANAAICALVLSGLPGERFVFEGFLPRSGKAREAALEAVAAETRTVIIYEAPHRLIKTLEDLHRHCGDREAAVARELTKMYEEVVRMTLSEALAYFSGHEPRGEFVIVIKGADTQSDPAADEKKILTAIEYFMAGGISISDAIKNTSEALKFPKNKVYRVYLNNKNKQDK